MAENGNPSYGTIGLNKDASINNIQPGQLTDAYNAVLETYNGDMVSYTNEVGNSFLLSLPEGFTVIGNKYVPELNYTLYFLTNNTNSIIGIIRDNKDTFEALIDDRFPGSDKLNLSINQPIQEIVIKHTNCSTEVYWTDGHNPMSYINLLDLPWKETPNPNNEYIPIKQVGQLDSNKIKVIPDIVIPTITLEKLDTGGLLTTGTYQFAVAYTNGIGERYSSVYSVTNPLSIKSIQIGQDFNTTSNSSIAITVDNIDNTGLYDWFSLYVIKTINDIATPYRVGTFAVNSSTFSYNYTGTAIEEAIDMFEIFEKRNYYDIAQNVTETDGVIIWSDLKANLTINYQQIAFKVKANWVSYQLPYTDSEGYNNENTALYKSFMRDEVYPLHIFFYLRNGRQTESFPLIGRDLFPGNIESTIIKDNNSFATVDQCEDPIDKNYWEVYNTATDLGYTEEYIQYKRDKYGESYLSNIDSIETCYKGPYKYGDFAYWESNDKYDNNPYIYGTKAGSTIKHFKFPDNIISPIHQQVGVGNTAEHVVYPIGIRIDEESLKNAIYTSNLTPIQKEDIIGYGIVRGDRTANKSVVAKGIFSNVGKYTYKNKDRYYANYPYNDLNPDPYFVKSKLRANVGYMPSRSLSGFSTDSKSRFTFHSPDTHFRQPSAITGGYLKLETIESGISYGHFIPVDKNSEYKFLTTDTVKAAAGVGVASAIKVGTGTFGWPSVDLASTVPTFVGTRELFEKIIPFTNFGYTYNSVGYYGTHHPIPNTNNNKIRPISYSKYVTEGFNTIDSGLELNHTGRESSLYIKTNGGLLFPHEYFPQIQDFSRYNLSSYSNSTYNIEDYYNEFVATNSGIVTQSDINSVLTNYLLDKGTDFRVVFVLEGMPEATTLINLELNPGDLYTQPGFIWEIGSIQTQAIPNSNKFNGYVTALNPLGLVNPLLVPSSGNLTLLSTQSDLNPAVSWRYDSLQKLNDFQWVTPDAIRHALQEASGYPYTLDVINSWSDNPNYKYQLAYEAFILGYTNERRKYAIDLLEPEEIRESPISCYYGSIKRYLPSQWNRIGSYELVSTGFYYTSKSPLYKSTSKYNDIFGGDTFITRFALKTKVPFFVDDTVLEHNQADIQYDKLGQYGYPMFWLSTKPEDTSINITDEVNRLVDIMERSPGVGGSGSTLSKVLTTILGVASGGLLNVGPVIRLLVRMMKEIWTKVAISNINLDNQTIDGIMQQGIMYLYSYGIPYYFVESSINTDLRQAYNTEEGDFYPHVSGGIPDRWLQESTVPIIQDNTYFYNWTYSKDNRENSFPLIRQDFDPNKECYTLFPNRAIYSDKSSLEETKNNWLFYRPLSYYDFPKSYGTLTTLTGIDNSRVLARFTNKSQIYNALTTIQISENVPAEIGNPSMFQTRPLDLSHNDIGSGGSQHKFILQTDNGIVYTDCIRGEIFLLQGTTLKSISENGMSKWFNDKLPFKITDSFPTVPTDNSFKDIGIHGVYDLENHRIIITKLDYTPIIEGITYRDNNFYYNNQIISVADKVYFCDKSFTISYSFLTNSWVSLHTYYPNYYVSKPTHYLSNKENTVWTHGLVKTLYNNFYGQIHPYEIEYGVSYQVNDEILQYVKDYTIVRKYQDYNLYTIPKETIFFNKAVIRNGNQCTGILNLIPQDKSNLSQRFQYPKRLQDSTDILVSKSDNLYQYNQIVDIVKDQNTNIILPSCSGIYYNINHDNMDYGNSPRKKPQIRGKYVQIRHILDNTSDYQLVSNFNLSPTAISYK